MYIPPEFQAQDRAQLIAFMRRYSFGVLVTVVNGAPWATHLPFVVETRPNGKLILCSHLAKANPAAGSLVQGRPLVIFSEPSAYISPTHYSKQQNVPTWNYIAVHAYGPIRRLEDAVDARSLLEKMI